MRRYMDEVVGLADEREKAYRQPFQLMHTTQRGGSSAAGQQFPLRMRPASLYQNAVPIWNWNV